MKRLFVRVAILDRRVRASGRMPSGHRSYSIESVYNFHAQAVEGAPKPGVRVRGTAACGSGQDYRYVCERPPRTREGESRVPIGFSCGRARSGWHQTEGTHSWAPLGRQDWKIGGGDAQHHRQDFHLFSLNSTLRAGHE